MEPYLLQDEELKELVVKIPGWEIKMNKSKENLNFLILLKPSLL